MERGSVKTGTNSSGSILFPKPAQWTFEEGIRIGWGSAMAHVPMHEPLYFLNARGNAGDNEAQLHAFRRTRAYLEHLADLGCTQVWFNWWKGFGLEHERECMRQVADLFPICRELGLRSIAYFSLGSLTPDTLLAEAPEAEDWMTLTQNGGRASCQTTHQCFRVRPCFTSEGYLSYMEKVLAECLDAGADGIHFDNIGMPAEPEACHCPRCVQQFRTYLQERYRGNLGAELFGMSDFRHASVPWFNQHNTANNLKRASVPLHRAWIDFKCEVYASAASRLIDFIRSRKADAFVEMNLMEPDGFAAGFWRGNDYAMLMPKLEMVCDEGNRQDGLNKRGAIVGAYRAKKWARAFGCAHNSGARTRQLASQFAEDLAFSNAPKTFWNKHRDYQLQSRSQAEVAVLREQLSLRYNRFEPWEETLAAEQYLIERRIPFDIVSNVHLENLDGRCRLLVLAGVELVSDAMRDRIADWVGQGGNLLLVGRTGMYDEHYRVRRRRVAVVETMEQYRQALQPCNAFHALVGEDPHGGDSDVLIRECGRGRVGWLRGLDVDRVPRTAESWIIPYDMFMMPRNAWQLDEVLVSLLPDRRLQVNTDGRLYVHHARRTDTGEDLVHLINHGFPPQIAMADVALRAEREVQDVVSVSVDDVEDEYPLRRETFEMRGEWLHVPVAGIRHHRSLIVRWQTS